LAPRLPAPKPAPPVARFATQRAQQQQQQQQQAAAAAAAAKRSRSHGAALRSRDALPRSAQQQLAAASPSSA
jgi:hypothetical protein